MPQARGPASRALLTLISGPALDDLGIVVSSDLAELWRRDDVPWWEADDDAALALVHIDELQRRGLEGVPDGWEGHPLLAAARWTLAGPVRRGLHRLAAESDAELPSRLTGCGTVRHVLGLVAASPEPAGGIDGAPEPFDDAVIRTCAQRLRERDAHLMVLPSLAGVPRHLLLRAAAGDGQPCDTDGPREAVGRVLRALGVSDRTGSHLQTLPGAALWRLAVLSHLATHRSLRAATLGWLVAADALATAGRFVTGDDLRARGFDAQTARAWDACVIGDLATLEATELLVDAEPSLARDVVLGARACLASAAGVEAELTDQPVGRRREPLDAQTRASDLTPTEGLR